MWVSRGLSQPPPQFRQLSGRAPIGRLRSWLPQPSRQSLERGPRGRIYLDVRWEDIGLVVEIDGVAHTWGLAMVDDALRQNSVVIQHGTVLRIPVLGLRTDAARFMNQVCQAHAFLTRQQGNRRGLSVVEVGL